MTHVRSSETTLGRTRPGTGLVASATLARMGPAIGQVGLPFLLIVYLGMRGGGYDEVIRSEVGIIAWWVVLLGAVVGALPVARIGKASWIALGFLSAFAAWTALGVTWSDSDERTIAELGRVASLLGVFALFATVGGGAALRRVTTGVAAGVAVIGVVALLSRLHPAWFPALEIPDLIPGTEARLHYPVQYWNGLAALMAIGIPLILALADVARNLAIRSIALAILPALALAGFFTLSRGGLVELAAGLAVLLALHPRRGALAVSAAPAVLGAAILIAAANQRGALTDGLSTPAAASQGDEMIFMVAVVCLGVGLVSYASGLAVRHGAGPRIETPRARRPVLAVAVAVLIGIAIAAGVPGAAGEAWDGFKQAEVPLSETGRFDSSSGSGRYQWWSSAADANATAPLVGIGPGTFEYWWAREGTISGFVRDAHSLYMETFAEAGIVGLLLIVGIVATPFVVGLGRMRSADPETRVMIAGALAACTAFAVAAALEWVWELTVIPVAFLILSSALVAKPRERGAEKTGSNRKSRLALGALAMLGIGAISIPLAGTNAIRDSQAQVRAQDLDSALELARTAVGIQPYAAAASLQEALVLEEQGDFPAAVAAAGAAVDKEPSNWRNWLILSRLEAKAGNATGSVDAYRQARELNPRSILFQ